MLNVRDFGAMGDEQHDDTAAFVACFAAANASRDVVYIPAPPGIRYRVFASIYAGGTGGIMGDGPASLVSFWVNDQPCLDCTGLQEASIQRVQFKAEECSPTVVVLLARRSDGKGSDVHLHDVTVRGSPSAALVYEYGFEEDVWMQSRLYGGTSAAPAYYVTNHNALGITSPHVQIASGTWSNNGHRFQMCKLQHNNPTLARGIAIVESAADVHFDGCYFNYSGSWPAHCGDAIVLCGGDCVSVEKSLFHGREIRTHVVVEQVESDRLRGFSYRLNSGSLDSIAFDLRTGKLGGVTRIEADQDIYMLDRAIKIILSGDVENDCIVSGRNIEIGGGFQGTVRHRSNDLLAIADPARFKGIIHETDTGKLIT